MAVTNRAFDQEQYAVRVPLWREALLLPEWLRLRTSPIFYGQGIARGNGAAVVTIPGFMCSDLYTGCLTNWLQRIGYRAYPSRIERNNDCLETVLRRVLNTIEQAAAETGGKVHLIGHSLGGILARIATIQQPERVASVLTLASPFRGVRAHPYILWLGRRVRTRVQSEDAPHCFTGFCPCPSVTALQSDWPASVPTWAIYTKTDGIVDWQACLNDDPTCNVEVAGTHVGLVFNAQVYRFIAERLAQTQLVSETRAFGWAGNSLR
ncbi:MAG TPA: alpha/beta fold hydrolase [Blastocatellia bacterium]|nr:alpha/beta fold hydrolase [Blastocatellia bacterium]